MARDTIVKSRPSSTVFGEVLKFIAPNEAATQQAAHLQPPPESPSITPPAAVSSPSIGAATSTGREHASAIAQKAMTAQKCEARTAKQKASVETS